MNHVSLNEIKENNEDWIISFHGQILKQPSLPLEHDFRVVRRSIRDVLRGIVSTGWNYPSVPIRYQRNVSGSTCVINGLTSNMAMAYQHTCIDRLGVWNNLEAPLAFMWGQASGGWVRAILIKGKFIIFISRNTVTVFIYQLCVCF